MPQPLNHHGRRPKTIDHLSTALLAVSFLIGNLDVLGSRNAWWAHPLAYTLAGVVVGIAVGRFARQDGMTPQEEHFQGRSNPIKTLFFWTAVLASLALVLQVVVHAAKSR